LQTDRNPAKEFLECAVVSAHPRGFKKTEGREKPTVGGFSSRAGFVLVRTDTLSVMGIQATAPRWSWRRPLPSAPSGCCAAKWLLLSSIPHVVGFESANRTRPSVCITEFGCRLFYFGDGDWSGT